MSTIGYALFSPSKTAAPPSLATQREPSAISRYIEVLAGLVPAEVLAVHALAVSLMFTTTRSGDSVTTTMTNAALLRGTFVALVALSLFLYVGARVLPRNRWQRSDFIRMLIPPLAFVGWTMLQRSTAFDAVWPGLDPILRTMIAVIGAVALASLAQRLTSQGDS
jgi:hypothetical protein